MRYPSIVVLVLVGAMIPSAVPQRPFYAPKPIVYPNTLAQFGGPPPESSSSGLESRFGEDSNTVTGTQYQRDLVDRVGQWPKEKQPFWYVNDRQLASHIGLM